MAGYSEYTRLRDIAVKRAARLSNKGLAPEINFPTVKELKAKNISVESAIRSIQKFTNAPTTVREFKRLEGPQRASALSVARNAIANEKRKAAHREANRRYREKMRGLTKRERGYIKAAHTLGIKNVGDTRAFSEYIAMRFSQASEQSPYAIADYTEDFKKLVEKGGYSPKDIVKDYNQFLSDRESLIESGQIMDNGISASDGDSLFSQFMEFRLGE